MYQNDKFWMFNPDWIVCPSIDNSDKYVPVVLTCRDHNIWVQNIIWYTHVDNNSIFYPYWNQNSYVIRRSKAIPAYLQDPQTIALSSKFMIKKEYLMELTLAQSKAMEIFISRKNINRTYIEHTIAPIG